ncbi:MAG: hypothetical protein AAF587_23510 [Bacteroidota bacterium]
MHRFTVLFLFSVVFSGVNAQTASFARASYIQLSPQGTVLFQDVSKISSGFYVQNQHLRPQDGYAIWTNGSQILVLSEEVSPTNQGVQHAANEHTYVLPGIGNISHTFWQQSSILAADNIEPYPIDYVATQDNKQHHRFETAFNLGHLIKLVASYED